MSDRTTVSVRVSADLSNALDLLANEANTSKSEIVRETLRDTVIDGNISDLPEHVVVLGQRDKMIEGRNRLRDMRCGFEERTAKQLHYRYHSGGYSAEDVETIAENYHAEIDILWPEWSDSDYAQERRKAHAKVRELVDTYHDIEDLDDPETVAEENMEEVRQTAYDLLKNQVESEQPTRPRKVERMLLSTPGISQEQALSAVRDAREQLPIGGESEDEGGLADD